jgi:hypothetical protein
MTRIPAPVPALALRLARKANIRQWVSGPDRSFATPSCTCRIRPSAAEIRRAALSRREHAEKDEEIVAPVMQWLQGGLAWLSVALRAQHT